MNWLIWAIAVAFGLGIVAAGVMVHFVARDLASRYTGVGLNPFEPGPENQSSGSVEPGATPTLVTLDVVPEPWDGKARVTVLVMGVDYRDWVAGEGSPRSDTMMLVTVDPITLQAGMLSIPRDLWVEIPGFGFNRINTAYMLGEAYRLPGGGPELAMRTVEGVIGVPIQYYMVVDFHTFERMIDEVGGVDILVSQRIRIHMIGGESEWLEAKPQHLNGAEALAYARVRKGEAAGGDFGRAQRQQQVILAIMDEVVGLNQLPKLISKAPALYQELSSGVRTNLTLEQMISLAWLATRVPKENIRQGVIGPPKMVGFYTRPDGAQVLRPVPDQIRALRDYIFTETSAFGPSIVEAPTEGYRP